MHVLDHPGADLDNEVLLQPRTAGPRQSARLETGQLDGPARRTSDEGGHGAGSAAPLVPARWEHGVVDVLGQRPEVIPTGFVLSRPIAVGRLALDDDEVRDVL